MPSEPTQDGEHDVEGGGMDGDGGVPPIGKGVAAVITDPEFNYVSDFDFGTVSVDGSGGSLATHKFRLVNIGDRDLTIGFPGPTRPKIYDRIIRVALIHLVGIEDLPTQSATTNGPA